MLNTTVKIVESRKRIGRGGGRGGSSGRGHKGQKARTSGPVRPTFEGGQMPLVRRLPKRGFCNARFENTCEIVNLADLERVFADGQEVTREALIEKGLIRGRRGWGVKVLGKGELTKKLTVAIGAVSKSAAAAIAGRGGVVRQVLEEVKS